jgi:UDP-glucose 4-epimerase
VRNLDGVGMAIRDKDIVFNCAGFTSHPNSMRDPYEDIDVNCKGVVNVLEAGRRYNRDAKIVHVGTSTQIGKMQREPIDELHPEFPLDIYSANKTAGEKYTLIYGHAYGMRTTVVRLANTFGPRACIRTPEFGFMNFFIGLALQGKEITVFGEGLQKRNISYVEDSASALIAAALDDAANGKTFFATADEQITVRRVAEATAEVVGGKVRFVEWPPERAAIEIGDAVIANDKICQTLNWKPEISLEEGLRRTRDYFQPRIKDYLR